MFCVRTIIFLSFFCFFFICFSTICVVHVSMCSWRAVASSQWQVVRSSCFLFLVDAVNGHPRGLSRRMMG